MKTWTATVIVPEETRGWGENKRTLPALQAKVELRIDLDKIVNHLGHKAARSKGGMTNALGGMVKLKVLSLKEQ